MTPEKRSVGQPRKFADPVRFSITMDRSDLDKIQRYMEKHKVSRSEAVRDALKKLR